MGFAMEVVQHLLRVAWNLVMALLELLPEPIRAVEGFPVKRKSVKKVTDPLPQGLLTPRKMRPGNGILVVGASDGSEDAAKQALEAGATVCIIDSSTVVLAGLRRRMEAERIRGWQQGSLQLLCEEVEDHSGEYDTVVINGVLDGDKQLKTKWPHICSLIRPGGSLVVCEDAYVPGIFIRLVNYLIGRPVPEPLAWVGELPMDMKVEARKKLVGTTKDVVIVERLLGGVGHFSNAVEILRRKYGSSSMAFSTSGKANRIDRPENNLRYFFVLDENDEETGFIAYTEYQVLGARMRCVVTDPICKPGTLDQLVQEFLEECKLLKVNPLFTCVSASVVPALAACGFHTTKLGSQVAIPLADFSTPKDRRRYLRKAASKGLECHEVCYDSAEFSRLSQDWLSNKARSQEVTIWTWPPSMPLKNFDEMEDEAADAEAAMLAEADAKEAKKAGILDIHTADISSDEDSPRATFLVQGVDSTGAPPTPSKAADSTGGAPTSEMLQAPADEVKRLFTYQDGRLVGFVCAEPFYKGDGSGDILGYGLNTIRFASNVKPAWASDFTVATLIEKLKAEKEAKYLAFGLSPFTELRETEGDDEFLRGFFSLMWDCNFSQFYSFLGLAMKKAHHCADQGVYLEERFVCGPKETRIRDFMRLLSLLAGDDTGKIPEEVAGIVGRTAWRILTSAKRPVGMARSAARRAWRQACHYYRDWGAAPRTRSRRSTRSLSKKMLIPKAPKGVGPLPNTEKAELFISCLFAPPFFGAAAAMGYLLLRGVF